MLKVTNGSIVKSSETPSWHFVPGATGKTADHWPSAQRWNELPLMHFHEPSLLQEEPPPLDDDSGVAGAEATSSVVVGGKPVTVTKAEAVMTLVVEGLIVSSASRRCNLVLTLFSFFLVSLHKPRFSSAGRGIVV